MEIPFSDPLFQQLRALFEISKYEVFVSTHSAINDQSMIRLHTFQNPKSQWHKENRYFFYFTGEIDQPNSHKIIQELIANAQATLPLSATLMGPLQFSTYLDYRICLENPGKTPLEVNRRYVGEPLTPATLLPCLRALGFKKNQLYKTYVLKKAETKNKIFNQFKGEGFLAIKSQFQLKIFDLGQWKQNKESFYKLTMELFSENPGFQHLSPQQFEMIVNENYFKSVCYKSSLCLYKDEVLVGYSLNFIETEMTDSTKKNLLIKTAGVTKLHRNLGMTFLYLVSEIMQRCSEYHQIKFCLMKDGNFPSLIAKDFIDETLQYAMLENASS